MFDRGYDPPAEAEQLLGILAERFTDPEFFPRLDGTASVSQLGQLANIYEAIRPADCQPLQVAVAWAAERYLARQPRQVIGGAQNDSYPSLECVDRAPTGTERIADIDVTAILRQMENEITAQKAHKRRIQLIRAKLITGFLAFVLVPEAGPDELPDVLHVVEKWVGAADYPRSHGGGASPAMEVQEGAGGESSFLATALGLSICCAYHRLENRKFAV